MPRTFPTTPYPSDSDGGISYNVDVSLDRFTGSTLVIGDTVFISQEGIEILAGDSGSYDAVNAYSFRDADGQEIGGLYGRDDSGQNVAGFRVVDAAGSDDDTVLEIASTSTTDATATVTLQADRSGESTDTYIYLERGDSSSEIDLITNAAGGRVRLKPKLNLVGASLEVVDLYIKGTNFILKYNDAGTTRYKYLDLSGSGTAWQHSTTEP